MFLVFTHGFSQAKGSSTRVKLWGFQSGTDEFTFKTTSQLHSIHYRVSYTYSLSSNKHTYKHTVTKTAVLEHIFYGTEPQGQRGLSRRQGKAT